MNSKYYKSGVDSELESSWDNNSELTDLPTKATHYVNPEWNALIGKTIIINLPERINLDKISKYNKIISRYPLLNKNIKYQLVPYPEVQYRLTDRKDYSKRILNKYLLTDPNIKLDEDRFLLGTDIEVNDGITLIGYLLVKTIKS